MPNRVARYLAHLDRLSGGVEPRFFQLESTTPALAGVTAVAYPGVPEGLLTGFSYGLSLADHPEWKYGRPELCLSVRSTDLAWVHAVGFVAERLRGTCPFTYGTTVDFGGRVCAESAMTAFAVFAPAVVASEHARDLDLGPSAAAAARDGAAGAVPDLVHLQGLYPVHASERAYIDAHGPDALWSFTFDPLDVRRAPVV